MYEWLTLALVLAAGLILGAFFFGGLWWTVRMGVASKRPVLWFLGSLLLRTAIVVAGFYLVSDAQWQRLLICLLGFAVARFLVMRVAGPPLKHYTAPAQESGRAP